MRKRTATNVVIRRCLAFKKEIAELQEINQKLLQACEDSRLVMLAAEPNFENTSKFVKQIWERTMNKLGDAISKARGENQ